MKITSPLVYASVFIFSIALTASAHVVVKPSTVLPSAFQTFTVGVPSEKSIGTVGLRLELPQGLTYVTPNVKNGWKITVKKEGVGEKAVSTEIDWVGGYIPSGQRDEFMFSARVPADMTELHWNAYQTYEDGSIVSWNASPDPAVTSFASSGPYSVTKVVPIEPVERDTTPYIALALSLVAFGFAVTAFNRSRK